MKTLIVMVSKHHGNTEKLVQAMKPILEADVVTPDKFDITSLDSYDLIGFASGIYMANPDKDLFKLIETIPYKKGRKAFTVITNGGPMNYEHRFDSHLTKKGFDIVGNFTSKGWATFAFLGLFGGMSKGRPNEDDLERARQFARDISVK